MKAEFINGIFVLLGILLGSGFTWLINYLKERTDRKHRYFFALLEKRFTINSQAYCYIENIKGSIHKDDLNNVVNKIRKWHNENILYLSPYVREKYKNALQKADFYQMNWKDWQRAAQRGDVSAKEKSDKLTKDFEFIFKTIQEEILSEFDQNYYKQMKMGHIEKLTSNE